MAPASEASSQESQLPQRGAEEPTDLWEARVGNSLLAGCQDLAGVHMYIQPPQVREKTGHPAGPHPTPRPWPGYSKYVHIPSHSQPASVRGQPFF